MPAGMAFEEAAAVFDGATQALGALTEAGVGRGTRLLVYGASGSCGTAAVQLAKRHLGAHVTAVCNTKNVELVRSLGADEVVDYLQEDFTRNGETYDVVLDAVGKHSFFRCRRSLKPGGRFVATDGLYNFPLAFVTSADRRAERSSSPSRARRRRTHSSSRSCSRRGSTAPVIDRVQPLEEVVEAHRYVDTRQKTGNVVLTLKTSEAR